MTNLTQKFTALETALTGRLDSIVTSNEAIAAALVALGHCICDEFGIDGGDGGGETDPPPPGNEPPSVGCTNYLRVENMASWQFQGTRTISGTPCNLYAPIFNYSAGLQGWRPHTLTEADKRAHIINQNYNSIFWCMVWNFTGVTAPLMIYRDISNSNYSSIAGSTAGFEIPNSNQATGSWAEDRPAPWLGPGNPDAHTYLQYIVAYPQSEGAPPKYVWLRYPAAG